MATKTTSPIRVVSGGGPITKDVYKSYYNNGTAAQEDWRAGELLYLTVGTIHRIGTYDTAAQIDTDDAGFSAAVRHFIALEDHDANLYGGINYIGSSLEGTACAASVYVAVQEIFTDTVLEIQIGASSTEEPTIAVIKLLEAANTTLGLMKTGAAATGVLGNVWGVDATDATTKGVITVVNYDTDTEWMKSETGVATTVGSGRFLRAKLIQSVCLV